MFWGRADMSSGQGRGARGNRIHRMLRKKGCLFSGKSQRFY